METRTASQTLRLVIAAAMLGLAGRLVYSSALKGRNASDRAFFYDLREKKLFTAPRDSVPPIKGLKGGEDDGVRAIVIATNGNPADHSARTIAYLEKYSPTLKAQILRARREGGSLEMGRTEAMGHRLVKRLADSEWFPMSSPIGERIVSEWAVPRPNGGVVPVVCLP